MLMKKDDIPFLQETTHPGEYVRGVMNVRGAWHHLVTDCK
jgi:hypothetical protein